MTVTFAHGLVVSKGDHKLRFFLRLLGVGGGGGRIVLGSGLIDRLALILGRRVFGILGCDLVAIGVLLVGVAVTLCGLRREDGLALIANVSDKSSLLVGLVCDGLDAAVGEVNGVRSNDCASLILLLDGLIIGTSVLVGNSILELVGL